MKRLLIGAAILALCAVAYQQHELAETARAETLSLQADRDRENAERARQQEETNNLLREQMDRDQCLQFMRVGDFDQAISLVACSNPDSPLRVRLRSRR